MYMYNYLFYYSS